MPGIKLANCHVIFDAAIAKQFFGAGSHVNIVYYDQRKTMLLAPVEDELFKGLHKTAMVMLKFKNSRGDKSLSIEEVVIDNDIDPADRELTFNADIAMKIISIYF